MINIIIRQRSYLAVSLFSNCPFSIYKNFGSHLFNPNHQSDHQEKDAQSKLVYLNTSQHFNFKRLNENFSHTILHQKIQQQKKDEKGGTHMSKKQRIKNKELQYQKKLNQNLHLPFIHNQEKQKFKVNKFIRRYNITLKMQNSSKFEQLLGSLLQEQQFRKIMNLLTEYIDKEGFVEGVNTKPTKKQKKLFKDIRKLLFQYIQDADSVEEIMNLFARCNPKFIQIKQIKKIRQLHENTEIAPQKNLKHQFSLTNYQIGEEKQFENMGGKQKKSQNKFYKIVKDIEVEKRINTKRSAAKLFLKKDQSANILFNADDTSKEKIEKKVFGNKKIQLDEHIFFRKTKMVQNVDNQNFGKNWVYAYDLPYSTTMGAGEQIVHTIQKKYGKISQFLIYPYKNMVEKNEEETIFVIPQNLKENSWMEKIKIEKIKKKKDDLVVNFSKRSKSLTSKILQKTQKDKDCSFNKSSMVFKFAKYQSKVNFLTPEMRLFGLNLGKNINNIRFEEAQSKNIVVLSMIPWGSDSHHILRLINNVLSSLKIFLECPSCVITRSYIFIELQTFYEALYTKDLLNNIIFENCRLKAQLIYGASQIYQGQYKSNFNTNHYDSLVQKLSEIRSSYSDTNLL